MIILVALGALLLWIGGFCIGFVVRGRVDEELEKDRNRPLGDK